MKKTLTLMIVMMMCISFLAACKKDVKTELPEEPAETVTTAEADPDTDEHNRQVFAEAMGWAEDNRKLQFYISICNTINAGKIQSAEPGQEDIDKIIDVVSEDGTNYRFYLSGSDSIMAVKNVDTGEWPVTSFA